MKHMVCSYTSPEFVIALSIKLYKSRKRSIADVLNESNSTPKRALKHKKALINYYKLKPVSYSPDEALSFSLLKII